MANLKVSSSKVILKIPQTIITVMNSSTIKIEALIDELSSIANPKWIYGNDEFTPGVTPIYYSGPFFDNREIRAALKAFLTGKWLVSGEHVHKFQIQFAKYFNVKYAHMVNSGSSANLVMIAALKKLLGWQDGDEVIVSPVGFPTTIAPLVQNGLVPVFADIEMDTLNFDLDKVRQALTPRTKAVFVSPVLGNPPDMDKLKVMCDLHGIQLIGDNCDSLGSRWNGRLITDHYYAWSTSFYPAHHITTGEGGMVCSNNEELIDLVRSISWWGRDCYCVGSANLLACGTCGKRFDTWLEGYNGTVDHKYVFSNMGYNLKPLDLQGAIGSVQLDKFDTIHYNRRTSKETIQRSIEQYIQGARVVNELSSAETSWFGVPIVMDSSEMKTKLQQFFEDNKIQTRNYFAGNILLHPGYSHLDDYRKYPNANKALSNVFFLGASPHYTDQIFTYIDEVCKQWKP
jgi:CDP-6-deoxy-D-xylo-4-hexulose-3-dehydrase